MSLELLPRLGVGISCEFESNRRGIDASQFVEEHPGLIHFLEYGGDLQRGLDEQVYRWIEPGRPTTYHFLDLNLEQREDADDTWLEETTSMAKEINAAWICGDAGLWHFGKRERGHQTLLPPILTRESAKELAENVKYVEEKTGFRCLPENPPGVLYIGPLHILDYFGLVSANAGCGLLLDVAHLAIFQKLKGLPATTGLDNFPLDRVIEVHVAGGVEASFEGFAYVEDNHTPEPLKETWEILEYVLPRAKNLKAIVYESEMNRQEELLPNFARLNQLFPVSSA
jgi:uncharacterized protein (UPF0276 family)